MDPIQKLSRVKENKSKKPSGADSAKLGKVPADELSVLSDLQVRGPLPSTSCPLIDVLPTKHKALSSGKRS